MTIASSTSQTYEAGLVERLRSRNKTAVGEFYNTYRHRLFSLVFEQVGQDQATTEDIVQEVFLAALASLDKFRGDSQLYTWLRSIAFHKIKDFYRHQARQPKPEESFTDFTTLRLEQTTDSQPATSTVMESEEIRQSVHEALADLPEDYQQVLILKYLKDMPVLAISEIMGRSPKSVEGLLSRARRAMRANLGDNYHKPD
jgi:RNA polymerase sigma-70 factor (ECF subfamily)